MFRKHNKGSKVKASQAIWERYRKIRQNKGKVEKAAKMASNELRKAKHIQTDDTQTVNYNNNFNLDDIDSDVQFIKQVPVHPRNTLVQNSKKKIWKGKKRQWSWIYKTSSSSPTR